MMASLLPPPPLQSYKHTLNVKFYWFQIGIRECYNRDILYVFADEN